MESIFVMYEQFIKKKMKIPDNDIDKWWKEIIKNMPNEIIPLAQRYGFYLVRDKNFDFQSTLGNRLLLMSANVIINNYLQSVGPFIVVVSYN